MDETRAELNARSSRSVAPRAPDARSSRLLAVSLGALVVALIPCLFELSQYPPPLATKRLPDGSLVSLEAVTYGTTHRFSHGTWGQRIARLLLPAVLADRLGGGYDTATTAVPQLVCWFRTRPVSPRFVHVAIAGEGGCRLDWDSGGWFWSGRELTSCAVEGAFPRRARRIRVQVFGTAGRLLAEFVAPNPAPGPYPVWPAERLPSTKQDGPIAITLVSLATDLNPPGWAAASTGDRGWTHFRLRIRRAVTSDFVCTLSAVSLKDATGNAADVPMPPPRRGPDGDLDCWFVGRLCPEEPTVKLRLECEWTERGSARSRSETGLADLRRLDPETLWEVRNVPLPRVGRTEALARGAVRQGVEIDLDGMKRGWGKQANAVTVFVHDNSGATGHKLRLTPLRATDQDGRNLDLTASSSEGPFYGQPSSHTFRLSLQPGSTRANLLFRVHRSSVVEFTVRPQTGP